MSNPRYILPQNFVELIRKLRANYQINAKVDLDSALQPYSFSCAIGAKNVNERREQIELIEKVLSMVENDLTESSEKYLYALRVLVEACLFIKSEVHGSGSELVKLIDEALGLKNVNSMDEETRQSTLLTTEHFLNTNKPVNDKAPLKQNVNKVLEERNRFNALLEKWKKFEKFVAKECEKINVNKNRYMDFPITAVTMKVFEFPAWSIGTATGYILGDMFFKIAPLQAARNTFTQTVGVGVSSWFTAGSLGSLYMAPIWAGRLLDTFSGVSAAWILGTTLGLAGKGAGLGVGVGLDLSWKLASKSFNKLCETYYGKAQDPKLTGYRLLDGQYMIDGQEFRIIDADSVSEEQFSKSIVFKNGEIHIKIGNEKVVVNDEFIKNAEQEHPEIVENIKQLLKPESDIEQQQSISNNNNNNNSEPKGAKQLALKNKSPFFDEIKKKLDTKKIEIKKREIEKHEVVDNLSASI